jgi:hypothetical protein
MADKASNANRFAHDPHGHITAAGRSPCVFWRRSRSATPGKIEAEPAAGALRLVVAGCYNFVANQAGFRGVQSCPHSSVRFTGHIATPACWKCGGVVATRVLAKGGQ